MTNFAQLDNRKRLNLASVAKSDLYLITTEPSGRIILEPASIVSQLEQDFLSNPEALAAVDAYHADPSRLVRDPARQSAS